MAKEKKPVVIRNWNQALPDIGVACVYGHRRKGKTGMAWWLAEELHKANRPIAAYLFPKKGKKLLPKWVKFADNIQQVKKLRGHMIVADEMAIHANAREHQSDGNKEIYKLMALAAQCDQLLVLICQHTRQLDVGLVMEPDIIIFKKPSLLHIRFARPELKPEVTEAFDRFEQARGDERGWAFVVNFHNGRKGFLRTALPTFWSQELSKVYAIYELDVLTASDKKPSKSTKRVKKRSKSLTKTQK